MRHGSSFEAAINTLLDANGPVTVLTGAGISTESGVPDYRSPGSPWRANAPIGYQTFLADADARVEAWRRKFAMDDLYRGAQPNGGHRALTALAEAGLVGTLVTQNIDGLHQAAGFPADRLIEIHGNGTYARCLTCGMRHELVDVRSAFEATGEAPTCVCGGIIKSATVSFGESIKPDVIAASAAAAQSCAAFLVLGSSLVVKPAATLPLLALRNEAALVIVNREPTPLDEVATQVVRADVGQFLVVVADRHKQHTPALSFHVAVKN